MTQQYQFKIAKYKSGIKIVNYKMMTLTWLLKCKNKKKTSNFLKKFKKC